VPSSVPESREHCLFLFVLSAGRVSFLCFQPGLTPPGPPKSGHPLCSQALARPCFWVGPFLSCTPCPCAFPEPSFFGHHLVLVSRFLPPPRAFDVFLHVFTHVHLEFPAPPPVFVFFREILGTFFACFSSPPFPDYSSPPRFSLYT